MTKEIKPTIDPGVEVRTKTKEPLPTAPAGIPITWENAVFYPTPGATATASGVDLSPRVGEQRLDRGVKSKLMAIADGWVMCRRLRAVPYTMTLKEWQALPFVTPERPR